MTPTTSPGATARSTPSTAVSPPKRTTAPRTSSRSPICHHRVVAGAGQSLGQADQAVGAEGEHGDHAGADEHRRPVRHAAAAAEDLGEVHESEGAHSGADGRADAADDGQTE